MANSLPSSAQFSSQSISIMSNPHIPHLPNEILCEIASYLGDEDIPSLRLTAKVFHYITTDRFATFFHDRAYEMSPAGMKALVKITEHPELSNHIKVVIIVHGGGRHGSAKYHGLLQQAFQNLAAKRKSISIGLRRIQTTHNFHAKTRVAANRMRKFFDQKMLPAAKHAHLNVQSIVLDQRSFEGDHVDEEPWRLWDYPFLPLQNSLEHSLEIRVPSNDAQSLSSSGCLSLSPWGRTFRAAQAAVPGRTCVSWWHFSQLEILELRGCEVQLSWFFMLLTRVGSRIRSMRLFDVNLKCPAGSKSHCSTWVYIFETMRLYDMQLLQVCELGTLWNRNKNDLWLEGGDKTIRANTHAQVRTVISNLAAGIREFTLDG